MSQENVETVRALVEHYNATGDVLREMIDPEVEWVIDPAGFVAGTYRRHEGSQALVQSHGRGL